MCLNYAKNGGRKSRDTLPIRFPMRPYYFTICPTVEATVLYHDWPISFIYKMRLFCTKARSKKHFYDLRLNPLFKARAGNSLIGFLSKSLVFCPNISEWAICSKKRAIHSFAHFWWATWAICLWSLIFGEWPERLAHGRSFLVSDLIYSLTSIKKREWLNR